MCSTCSFYVLADLFEAAFTPADLVHVELEKKKKLQMFWSLIFAWL